MKQYLDLLQDILDNGVESEDRTGTGTLSVFGRQMRFDLSKGFPLLTTKKLHFKSIAIELLWFLQGNTNTEYLVDNGVRIWNEWAEKEDVLEEKKLDYLERFAIAADMGHRETIRGLDLNNKEVVDATLKELNVPETIRCKVRDKGDLGPIYGKQWRKWTVIRRADSLSLLSEYEESRFTDAGFSCLDSTPINSFWGKTVDQIGEVIKSIKEDPYSRRHIVNAWNVGELDFMNLVPCHFTFQFYVREGKLSCMWTQRSNDTFLGNPFNIASYALLTHMIAHLCDLEVGELIFSGGDVHIYKNHIEQVKEQLTRDPRPLPTLKFARKVNDIDDFKFEDFIIEGYVPHPHIAGKVAV